jgi:alpha-2-macroglobulin
MIQKLLHFVSRYKIPVIIGALVLVAAGAYGVYRAWPRPDSKGQQQLPLNAGTTTTTTTGGTSTMQGEASPMTIRLSAGQAQPQMVSLLTVATGESLEPGDVDSILSRLPEIQQAEQTDFKLAGEPIPPPRPGQTVQENFPPPPAEVQPPAVETGPLKVLRYQPEGEVSIAPFVNVTFSQPMVALDTIADLAANQVPVQIDPPLEGTWRWLGTRTLNFQYDSTLIDRLPKATEYHVTVPAGTKSLSGGELAEAVSWTFTTPPPKTTLTYPTGESQPLDPLFFIHFDQRIDPQAVLNTIRVDAGGQTVSLKLVGEEEIKADKNTASLLNGAVEGRWLAFKAQNPLPADTSIGVTVGPGTPSAEGPLTTKDTQFYTFRTYAPLRIEQSDCSYSNYDTKLCYPLSPFYIRFNNSIDDTKYDPSMLKIAPELPGASVNVFGNTISIEGASAGSTTYTVTISSELQDVFGQKLGHEEQVTFKVGQAQPVLMGSGENFVTLDPASKKPVFSVYAMNYARLEVQVYAVQPEDWPAFKDYVRNYQRNDIKVTIPGRQVMNKTLPVEAAADTLAEVNIDLSDLMDGQYGQFVVIVKPPVNLLKSKDDIYYQTVQTWVQVTQIGVDAFADYSDIVVWATNLKNGAPLEGVTITPQTGGPAQTGADGTARFAIPSGASYLVASKGADKALLPVSKYVWDDTTWTARSVTDSLRWYVVDDRQMYRPGEDVHLKGWLRVIGGKQTGDVVLPNGLEAVRYRVTDAQGNEITNGRVDAGPLGGFDIAFTIPEKVNLGNTYIALTAEGSLGNIDSYENGHSIQVLEFRRPEFEVTARNETPGPYFAEESAVVAVKANYYAGGALPNAEVNWQVTSTTGHYDPPNWPEFTFGTWTPWWGWGGEMYAKGGPYNPWGGGGTVESFTGTTDAAGEHYLNLDFEGGTTEPVSVTAQATVMDVNRQAWSSSTSLLVHPASLYVGLRSDKIFVDKGTPIKVDFIVVDLDGNPVGDRPVEVRAARLEWKYKDGTWQEVEADVQTCKEGSQPKPVTCTFETPLGGTYRITALVSDDKGRQNQTQFTRWVSGGKMPPARQVEQEQLTLIPDKENYQPGDVAEILVQSPFSPAEGLLTVNRSGLVYTERFKIEDGTTTLKIPIQDSYIPNINIQVDVNGSAPRTDDQGNDLPGVEPRPAYASGTLNLKVPPVQRTLAVQVNLGQSELEPGGETNLDLALKDANGQPVTDAEVAVIVVDEAVLALSNYQLTDPLSVFYMDRGADWWSIYGRSSIILVNPLSLMQQNGMANQVMSTQTVEKSLMGGARQMGEAMPQAMALPAAAPTMAAAMDSAGVANQQPAIRMRTDFNPLAAFAPSVRTNSDGVASVQVKLPDNLTRYRVMVMAVDSGGNRFGTGESNLVARLPLMVRPSAPRFLNFGDQFELPVVLQNQTDQDMTVDVAVRASNLTFTDTTDTNGFTDGARVVVPARDRVEVRFPAAAQMAGDATIQVAAVSGVFADAATVELPVYTPATTEAFATYGVIDDGAVAQPVAAPKDVFPQYGGLEITTSSTALQALTDAVLYLVSYPFECSEQLASRILAVAALRDVLTAFNAEGLPSPEAMEAAVQRDLLTLQGMQNPDGTMPYWRRDTEAAPFNTIHVAHALYRAQAKGFTVPADMQQRLSDVLRNIENYYPTWYDSNTRWTLSAYALYVRNLSGDRDPDKALRLIDEAGLENLSLDAVGWLWPVLEDAPSAGSRLEEIRRLVQNRVVETAGAANFTTVYDDQNYLLLGSDRRTDAILLDALMSDNPQSDLIPKLVNGLLAHRTAGRWGNTQENVFILLTLDRYFNTYEAQTPDFVARLWLGQNYVGSHDFVGRTTERSQTNVPMAYLVDPALGGGETQNLVLSKEGAGRLYYRLGLRYAPTSLKMAPLDMGFVVRREYEGVDNKDDVTRDADGTWHIKAGARVRVRVTMVADNRRYHVALVDPLPAGLEIVNPALAVSGSLPQDPNDSNGRFWWWWGPWYQHQNLRDERAEAFTTLLWDGVYDYTYIARATTPGTFVVPPSKAEEMYSPEVFGRSASDIVIVE